MLGLRPLFPLPSISQPEGLKVPVTQQLQLCHFLTYTEDKEDPIRQGEESRIPSTGQTGSPQTSVSAKVLLCASDARHFITQNSYCAMINKAPNGGKNELNHNTDSVLFRTTHFLATY